VYHWTIVMYYYGGGCVPLESSCVLLFWWLLGCYILCNEILVKVNQLMIEVEVD
jgi:hypothetical protein